MRRGELLGLRWVDVDLNNGRIAIRHTLVMVDGKPAMAEHKTAKGRRSLMLAPEVLDTLRVHRAHQAAERLSWGADYTDSVSSSRPRTAAHFTRRRFRACSSGRPSGQGCRRSHSMTSGTRLRRSCWRGVSTQR
jgi:integrase